MSGRERGIKYTDALVLTPENRFYRAEATTRPNDSNIDLLIFFANRYDYEMDDNVPIVDILVNPSSGHDLSSE